MLCNRRASAPGLGLLCTVLIGLSACEKLPMQMESGAEPAYAASNGAWSFTPLAVSAACRTPGSNEGYQPFDLPPGFTQAIVATEINDFRPVAGSGADVPDMIALNLTGPQAGRYLYRTHETSSNGAVTVTDLLTQTTKLVVQESHYEALDGIVWTPWGTVVFAEERTVATRRDPAVPNAVGGLVYEVDPAKDGAKAVARPAVGARSHEGLRFDPQGNFYGISESTPGVNGSGAIFKFVPDTKGDLSSGQLYALKVTDATTRTGPARWVPLDRAGSEINSDQTAMDAGATGWGRPEDIDIVRAADGNVVMFVAVTSEDLILRIELEGNRAFVSNFVEEGVNVTGLEDPDNLALDGFGNIYITEDNGAAGDIWAAGSVNDRVAGSVTRFASLSDCAAEPSGILFDPFRGVLWVHVQHAGPPLNNDLLVRIQPGQ
jgi:secreted PhoX family phosphatase